MSELLESMKQARAGKKAQLDTLLAKTNPTSADVTRADTLLDEVRDLDERIGNYAESERRAEIALRNKTETYGPSTERLSGGSPYGSAVRVTSEPMTYTEHGARTGKPEFLRDLFAAQVRNDPQAHARLARHGQEIIATRPELRAGTDSSMVPSFVPPQWMVQLVSDYARPGRPTADLVSNMPLPETGMELRVPRVKTPAEVAVQGAENAPVQTSEPEDETIVVPVVTIAGATDVSWQALERGTLVADLIYKDLGAAYAEAVDALVLDAIDDCTNPIEVTFTETSPTVTTLYQKVADGISKVRTERHRSPSAIVVSPRLWGWLTAEIADSDDRPWIVPAANGPANAAGVIGPMSGEGVVGTLQNVPVVIDAQIPQNLGAGTNQDVVYIASWDDVLLFEDAARSPLQLRFDAPGAGSLTSKLLCYGYAAVCATRQVKAIARIDGTGLIVPSL